MTKEDIKNNIEEDIKSDPSVKISGDILKDKLHLIVDELQNKTFDIDLSLIYTISKL
jgi:hypothetical protein